MKKEVTFHVLKGGHSMGRWKGAPVKAPAKSKGEVYQVTEEEVQTNEEEPMMPVILDDPKTDTKKPSTDDNGPEILMPTQY